LPPRPASRAGRFTRISRAKDHPEQTIRRNLDLLARHKSLADFIDALKTMDRSHQDPVGRSPLLLMEMILFVARAEKRRHPLIRGDAGVPRDQVCT